MKKLLDRGGHLFLPEAELVLLLSSLPSMGKVYVYTIGTQLCPQRATAWWGNPRLPSRACELSSTVMAKTYRAAGQAASALHTMALLQVNQAKAHEGSFDPDVMQELRTETDLALRAAKVTTRSLVQTMSTLLVQERHLWLNHRQI